MKYIRHSQLGLILFKNDIIHSDMAYAIKGRVSGSILSAGFINLKTLQCYGDSLSLNLSSLPEDTNLLQLEAL